MNYKIKYNKYIMNNEYLRNGEKRYRFFRPKDPPQLFRPEFLRPETIKQQNTNLVAEALKKNNKLKLLSKTKGILY